MQWKWMCAAILSTARGVSGDTEAEGAPGYVGSSGLHHTLTYRQQALSAEFNNHINKCFH